MRLPRKHTSFLFLVGGDDEREVERGRVSHCWERFRLPRFGVLENLLRRISVKVWLSR